MPSKKEIQRRQARKRKRNQRAKRKADTEEAGSLEGVEGLEGEMGKRVPKLTELHLTPEVPTANLIRKLSDLTGSTLGEVVTHIIETCGPISYPPPWNVREFTAKDLSATVAGRIVHELAEHSIYSYSSGMEVAVLNKCRLAVEDDIGTEDSDGTTIEDWQVESGMLIYEQEDEDRFILLLTGMFHQPDEGFDKYLHRKEAREDIQQKRGCPQTDVELAEQMALRAREVAIQAMLAKTPPMRRIEAPGPLLAAPEDEDTLGSEEAAVRAAMAAPNPPAREESRCGLDDWLDNLDDLIASL